MRRLKSNRGCVILTYWAVIRSFYRKTSELLFSEEVNNFEAISNLHPQFGKLKIRSNN